MFDLPMFLLSNKGKIKRLKFRRARMDRLTAQLERMESRFIASGVAYHGGKYFNDFSDLRVRVHETKSHLNKLIGEICDE